MSDVKTTHSYFPDVVQTLHKQSLAANHVSASTTTSPIDREVVNRLLFMIRQCTGTLPDVLAVLPGPRRL